MHGLLSQNYVFPKSNIDSWIELLIGPGLTSSYAPVRVGALVGLVFIVSDYAATI